MNTTTAAQRNTAAHRKAGFAPDQAVSLEAVLASAEAAIGSLLDAGDIDGAAALAEDTERFILATFGA